MKEKEILGKVPPNAVEVEEAVLGALLLEKDSFFIVDMILNEDCFYKEEHKIVYSAIKELNQKNEPCDILSVTNFLRKKGKLNDVGGAYYIAWLTNRVGSGVNIEYHSKIVKEQWIKRELINIGSRLMMEAYDNQVEAYDILDKAGYYLSKIETGQNSSSLKTAAQLSKEVWDYSIKVAAGEDMGGIYSGIESIDKITGKWLPGDLVLIGGRPSMGKTMTMMNIVMSNAIEKRKGLVISIEMKDLKLGIRLAASLAEIDSEKIKNGTMTTEERKAFDKAIGYMEQMPILIEDSITDINKIKSLVRKVKRKNPDLEYVMIDYVQKATGKNPEISNPSREQQISYISGLCKTIAKEEKVVVVLLSQLSRIDGKTKDFDSKKPDLSDLRESGSLEQDADIVLFPFRPAYYREYEGANGEDITDDIWFLIRKNRDGSIGDGVSKCNLRTQKIISTQLYNSQTELF